MPLPLITIMIKALIIVTFASVTVMVLVYLERKLSGHFQVRYGPMRVGWHGALQLIADTIKLLMKEDTTPKLADKMVFFIAPILAFVAAYLAYFVIPFAPGLVIKDLNIGLLYLFGVTSLTVLAILMAGWSSNNKYALLGGFRSVAQIVSYEVPLLLSVLPVIMAAGSLSLVKIVGAQSSVPFILVQPLSFLIYFIAATAE
ncbi:MAG: NADH-quinone oxidoreductase subunit H [Candidatus Margulisiibacteriota bacterium]